MSDVGAARVVGREARLATLRAFLGTRDPGGALLLSGGPGIGKTTLWEAGVEIARGCGYAIPVRAPERCGGAARLRGAR